MYRCLQHSEPALLVGDTGTGKTTVCQMLALMRGQKLHIINCNQHTETSDFLGGYRPIRYVAPNSRTLHGYDGQSAIPMQHCPRVTLVHHCCTSLSNAFRGLQTVVLGPCNHDPGGFTASQIVCMYPCILVCRLMGRVLQCT